MSTIATIGDQSSVVDAMPSNINLRYILLLIIILQKSILQMKHKTTLLVLFIYDIYILKNARVNF